MLHVDEQSHFLEIHPLDHPRTNFHSLTLFQGTACWPCRQRKVRCTNDLPCENCVKREHPQLCSYKPNRSSASKQGTISTGSNLGKKRAHSPDGSPENVQEGDRPPSGWRAAIGMYLNPGKTIEHLAE
jgi:hypothetical protein